MSSAAVVNKRLEAVLDGSMSDGYRQMSLAAAGLAVQDQRAALNDEVQAEVGTDLEEWIAE